MRQPLRFGLLMVSVTALAWIWAVVASAAEITPVRFIAANGLTVLVLEQHTLPIVQVHALVKVGSAQDPPGKAGLANLVASLLDEGTKTRSAKRIAEEIDFVGGTLETRAGEDFTTASVRVLKKHADLGIDLLADILRRPAFPEREVVRVRSQILGAIKSEQDEPALVADRLFRQLVFGSHPYQWPVIGTESSVAKLGRKDVRRFYTREYLPSQTILTVVGDISLDHAKGLVDKHFGSWKGGDPPARTAEKPPQIDKPVTKIARKELSQATIMLGHLGIARTNPDYYAVSVMNYIFGAGGFSSRLMDSIRDRQGLAYDVGSMFDANRMPGAFLVTLQTRTEAVNSAIAGVMAELHGMIDRPPTDEELADAKAYLMGSFPLRLDTTGKLADVLSQVEYFELGLDYFTQYPTWIDRVTKDDVQRVAKEYLHPKHYALVVVGNVSKVKVKP